MSLVLKLNTFETLTTFHNQKIKDNCIAVDTYHKIYAVNNEMNSLLKDLYENNISEETFNTSIDNQIVLDNKLSVIKLLKECLTDQNPVAFYYYPESKTNFRRNVFPEVPESLYKKYYKFQKKYGIIEKATGFCVIINEIKSDDANLISATEIAELQTSYSSGDFNKFLETIQEMQEDIEYYKNYISSFHNIIEKLETQNLEVQQQLHNKQISTWY